MTASNDDAVIFLLSQPGKERSLMINRLKILLDQPEYTALLKLSEQELRNPADQARLLVRQELIRLGLIPTTYDSQEKMSHYDSTC